MDLKLSAALYITDKHRDLTPSSLRVSCPPADRITWRQWWEKRYNDDYGQFIRANWSHFKALIKTEPAP